MALNKRKVLKELVKELEKNYLLQHACNKLGLTRSTVYRWMQDDEEFAVTIRAAQAVGRRFMSDYVESKLLKNIENQEQRAIEFWLKNNNEHYRSAEKAAQKKFDQLADELKQSRAALKAVGQESIYKDFIDWQKVMKYVESDEFKTAEEIRRGVYTGDMPHDRAVLEQARKIVAEMKRAEFFTDTSNLPDEYIDLVD